VSDRDLRVTNDGFRDGSPRPASPILQRASTCSSTSSACPGPLRDAATRSFPPHGQSTQASITRASPGQGFDPSLVIVVQPAAARSDTFVLIDVATGQTSSGWLGLERRQGCRPGTTTTLPQTTRHSLDNYHAANDPSMAVCRKTTWYGMKRVWCWDLPESEAVLRYGRPS